MNKVIVITGPTAVGKTKLSIELAKRYNGEIINADAVQVYKGLDIGSAKVTEEEKEDIPHHSIWVVICFAISVVSKLCDELALKCATTFHRSSSMIFLSQ